MHPSSSSIPVYAAVNPVSAFDRSRVSSSVNSQLISSSSTNSYYQDPYQSQSLSYPHANHYASIPASSYPSTYAYAGQMYEVGSGSSAPAAGLPPLASSSSSPFSGAGVNYNPYAQSQAVSVSSVAYQSAISASSNYYATSIQHNTQLQQQQQQQQQLHHPTPSHSIYSQQHQYPHQNPYSTSLLSPSQSQLSHSQSIPIPSSSSHSNAHLTSAQSTSSSSHPYAAYLNQSSSSSSPNLQSSLSSASSGAPSVYSCSSSSPPLVDQSSLADSITSRLRRSSVNGSGNNSLVQTHSAIVAATGESGSVMDLLSQVLGPEVANKFHDAGSHTHSHVYTSRAVSAPYDTSRGSSTTGNRRNSHSSNFNFDQFAQSIAEVEPLSGGTSLYNLNKTSRGGGSGGRGGSISGALGRGTSQIQTTFLSRFAAGPPNQDEVGFRHSAAPRRGARSGAGAGAGGSARAAAAAAAAAAASTSITSNSNSSYSPTSTTGRFSFPPSNAVLSSSAPPLYSSSSSSSSSAFSPSSSSSFFLPPRVLASDPFVRDKSELIKLHYEKIMQVHGETGEEITFYQLNNT